MDDEQKLEKLKGIASEMEGEAMRLYELQEIHWNNLGETQDISDHISETAMQVSEEFSEAIGKSYSQLTGFNKDFLFLGDELGEAPVWVAAKYLCQTAMFKAYFLHKVMEFDYIPPPSLSVPKNYLRHIVENKYRQSGNYLEWRLQLTIGWFLVHYPFSDLCERIGPSGQRFLEPENQFRKFVGLSMNYGALMARAESEFATETETSLQDVVNLKPGLFGVGIDLFKLGAYVRKTVDDYRSSKS